MSPICKHGLDPEHCSNCRINTLQTGLQGFSTKVEQYMGNLILEVLAEGKPWVETYLYIEN